MRESQGQGVGGTARRSLQIAAVQTYEGPAVPDCLVLHLCELVHILLHSCIPVSKASRSPCPTQLYTYNLKD